MVGVVRVSLVLKAFLGRRELEGPEEVVCLFEVRAYSEDLMDQVFNADDPVLAKLFLNDLVVSQRNS